MDFKLETYLACGDLYFFRDDVVMLQRRLELTEKTECRIITFFSEWIAVSIKTDKDKYERTVVILLSDIEYIELVKRFWEVE